MKTSIILTLVLMFGMLVASDNSSTLDGIIPVNVNSAVSSSSIATFAAYDIPMDDAGVEEEEVFPVPSGTDAFEFTVINTSSVSWIGSFCAGLDDVNYGGTDMLMSPTTFYDSLYFINYADGTKNDALALSSPNTAPWGCYQYEGLNINDYSDSVIYSTTDLGVSWTSYANPAGSIGRGMDFDYENSLVCETCSDQGVYSFSHLSTSGTFYDLSASIPSQLSGLAVYEHDGFHYLVINRYSPGPNASAYFFDLDDNLNFLGIAEYPFSVDCDNTYGLTYCDSRDSFFCIYNDGTDSWLVELQLTVGSLEHSTWGEIKSSF